jgi:hypothetical protein
MAGDISMGANKLKTTNALLKEESSGVLSVRNIGDTDYAQLWLSHLQFFTGIYGRNSPVYFDTQDTDAASLIMRARDTGVGKVEVACMAGATWAHLLLTRAKFGTTALTADVDHRGGLYVAEGGAGVADKLFIIMKNSLDGYEAVQIATAS